MRPESDSGGVAWAGRDLPSGPYAGDDGQPDPDLTAALASAAPPADHVVVVAVAVAQVLGAARVFVAVVPLPDSTADLALVTLERPDGRRALPVFTSPERLAEWRPGARPVPVSGRRAALSALTEGCELLHLDPGAPTEHLVRRPAVWAVAEEHAWLPSYANPVVTQEISRLLVDAGLIGHCEVGESAELRLVLSLPAGLDAQRVSDRTDELAGRLGASAIVAREVDSLEIVVRPL